MVAAFRDGERRGEQQPFVDKGFFALVALIAYRLGRQLLKQGAERQQQERGGDVKNAVYHCNVVRAHGSVNKREFEYCVKAVEERKEDGRAYHVE